MQRGRQFANGRSPHSLLQPLANYELHNPTIFDSVYRCDRPLFFCVQGENIKLVE